MASGSKGRGKYKSKAKGLGDGEKEMQETLSAANKSPSLFEAIQIHTGFQNVAKHKDDAHRFDVYVDFENAVYAFPEYYDMKDFRSDLEAAIQLHFKNRDYTIGNVYGACFSSCFRKKKILNDPIHNIVKMMDFKSIEQRTANCESRFRFVDRKKCKGFIKRFVKRFVGRDAEYKDPPKYERTTDQACAILCEMMDWHPFRMVPPCGALVITGDKDFSSAMSYLRNLGIPVMLAYTGSKELGETDELVRSASNNLVMDFKLHCMNKIEEFRSARLG